MRGLAVLKHDFPAPDKPGVERKGTGAEASERRGDHSDQSRGEFRAKQGSAWEVE